MSARASLDLGGITLRYVDEGTGPPVVMLHGNPSWSYLYRDLVTALCDRYRTIVPDHVGMGCSDRPARSRYPYDLRRRVQDLSDLLDALDLEGPVTLVVHDWGGMIGLAWAVDHPERVARLVLLNTAAFPLPAHKSLPLPLRLARAPVVGQVLVRGANAFARGTARFGVERPLTPEVRRAYLAPYSSWRRRLAVNEFLRDIPTDDAHPSHPLVAATGASLHRLADTPTLVCWGTRDPVFDLDYLAEWEQRLPHAEVHRIDAGHNVLEDAPHVVVPLVEDFLART